MLPEPYEITYCIAKDTLRSPLREEKSYGATLLALLEPCNAMSAPSDLTASLDQAYIHHAFIMKFPAGTRPPTGHLKVILEAAAIPFWTFSIINHLVSIHSSLSPCCITGARGQENKVSGHAESLFVSKHIINNLGAREASDWFPVC